MDNILFRCSSLGHLMVEPKEKSPMQKYSDAADNHAKLQGEYSLILNKQTKSANNKLAAILRASQLVNQLELEKGNPHLSETTITHLIDKYISVKYGRRNDIQSRYTIKGLQVEEHSLTLYARYKKAFDYPIRKNEETLSNKFISGTPDHFRGKIITEATHITDIKSSWDIYTYYRTRFKKLNPMYYWQLQGYMALTGAKTSTLAYCLVDTPDQLINDEKRKLLWKMGVLTDQDPDYLEACIEIEKAMLFSDIPINERVYEIDIARNDEDIERLYNRIKQCREYMNNHLFN